MKRAIEQKLVKWKENRYRKPLIVRGGRQVGKTHSISEFGANHYENYLLFDFEKEKTLHKIFSGSLSPEKIVMGLEVHSKTRITPGKTLLIFDEIQACPEALLCLRYFYEEMPEMHLIAAGSLLEFAMGDLSFPVGRVEFLWMRPLSFSEFLSAQEFNVITEKLPYLNDMKAYPEFVHEEIMEQLKIYFIVGGMPEAVKRYCETKSLNEVATVHKSLIQSYVRSFFKYRGKIDIDTLEKILEQIPRQVGKQIKYRNLDPERRIDKIKSALQVLERSLIVHSIHSTSAQGLPLGAEASSKIFKALFIDIGLMQHMCGVDPNSIINDYSYSTLFQGSLAEQFVGQELLANRVGSENDKLYYWSRSKKSSNAEIDYLVAVNGKIIPIEVKSGPSGKLKSLHLFLEEHTNSQKGVVFNTNPYISDQDQKLVFVPLYTIIQM